ncbi:hypothetical protein DENSPDRAFT_834337 [Dentipellis sp. KUC8613]|nr:hypothetical protein DENSPDRAFT_834337 [Dentipellis sp. KUC8613]
MYHPPSAFSPVQPHINLPNELLQHIIEDAWSLSLSPEDCIAILTSFPLVNKTFLVICNRLFFQDVQIPSVGYADHYLSLLRSPTHDEIQKGAVHSKLSIPSPHLVNSLCRSITFHMPGGPGYPAILPIQLYRDKHPMGQAMTTILYQINILGYTPSLERLVIQYTNWGYNDVFDHQRLLDVPQSVSSLELHFRFNTETPSRLVDSLRSRYFGRRRFGNWALPNIRHLTVTGGCTEFLLDTIQVCPALATLEIDMVLPLPQLAPLPPSLQSLTIRPPHGFILDKQATEKLQLTKAVLLGLLHPKSRRRLILRTSGADPRVLEHTIGICRNHSIDLIHIPCH